MEAESMPRKLWEHPDPRSTAMWRFMDEANRRQGLAMGTFDELYRWSCEQRAAFYGQLWEAQGWIHEGSYARVVDEAVPLTELPRWFAGVRLNWAENVLWTRGEDGGRATRHKEDGKTAVTEVREGNTDAVDVTWGELRARAAALASAMAARGVGEGDRVVAVGAHSVQTLVVQLATTWLGGVFSSSSTELGAEGLLQRVAQIDPKFVFFDDAALYNAKRVDLRPRMRAVVAGLRACPSFAGLVAVARFAGAPADTASLPATERLADFVRCAGAPPPIRRVGFQDAGMVFFLSGTTGAPKALVHGVGLLLMSVHKEAVLHRDAGPADVGLQFTTAGWIMHLASVGLLVTGARAVLYDGSPLVPDAAVLLRVAERQRVSMLGVGPRWMAEVRRAGVVPRRDADLACLRHVSSTGMVLPDDLFAWFYDEAFAPRVQLGNMSGGTDIAGCLVIDNPLSPLRVGGCVGPCLGVPVAVFDHGLPDGAAGSPLPPGQAGDLVATAAFPNLPLFLWGDARPAPGPRYRAAYLARFRHAWAQGDFCAVHPRSGAWLLLGRSDGVLNPAGVRFGSADVYAVVERRFAADVADALCVGQRRPRDADEAVVLFLRMRPGRRLDARLAARVRAAVARDLSKRHVPKYVFEVPDMPVTVNGKKVELPVKAIISGKTVAPSPTLLNPESLDFFYRFQNIEALAEPQAKL